MGTKPIPRPPMAPPGGYPDPNAPRVKFTCYNCGDPGHYSPNCPWPKAPKAIPILCGNCGGQGHMPLECPNPAKPKLLVKYVKDIDSKGDEEVRLIYMEEADEEEAKYYEEVDFLGGEVFKTSTRSMKQADYQQLREEMSKRKTKQDKSSPKKSRAEELPGGKQREGPPKETDPAYDRSNPKYYEGDISREAKSLLQDEQTRVKSGMTPFPAQRSETAVQRFGTQRSETAVEGDLRVRQPGIFTPKTVKFAGVKIEGNQGYDILKNVSQLKADVTIGELVKDNALYRRQLRPLVTGRKRKYKLPPTNIHRVEQEKEDLGPPDIEVQIAGCLVRKVPVDGGSSANIMIADTARALGFKKFEPTPKVLRMADQTRVTPVGALANISVIIGDRPFRVNFIVIEPPTPSTYPLLLGRPWLYQARVKTSWGDKTFTFGNPKTTITWETIVHQGETMSSNSGYTSGGSDSTIDSQWLDIAVNYIEVDEEAEDSGLSTLFVDDLLTLDVDPHSGLKPLHSGLGNSGLKPPSEAVSHHGRNLQDQNEVPNHEGMDLDEYPCLL